MLGGIHGKSKKKMKIGQFSRDPQWSCPYLIQVIEPKAKGTHLMTCHVTLLLGVILVS